MSDHPTEEQRWLTDLGEALAEADRVPRAVREAGYGVYAWRTIDAELAELAHDSLTEDPELVGSRALAVGPRTLTFATAEVTLELEAREAELLGQFAPPRAGELTVTLWDGTSRSFPVDELGCFVVDPVPSVPFRLRLTGEPGLATGWLTL